MRINTQYGAFLAASTSVVALVVSLGVAGAQPPVISIDDLLDPAVGAPAAEVHSNTEVNVEFATNPADAIQGDVDVTADQPSVDAGIDAADWVEVGGVTRAPEASVTAEAVEELKRSLPDDIEPVTAEEVKRLDRLGVLTRQKAVGEDILIIERELRRAETINGLIDLMGVEGFKKSFPDLYDLMKDSPVMLQAEIKHTELSHDLTAAKIPPGERDKEPEPEPVRRDDGSSFFAMPQAEAPGMDLADLDMPVRDVEVPVPEVQEAPISLREIYGSGSDYYAIITHGDERIRVTAGDELPGNTKVISVGDSYIDLIRNDREIRIRIQG